MDQYTQQIKMLQALYPNLPSLEQIVSQHEYAPAARELYKRIPKADVLQLEASYPQERRYLLNIARERESALVNYAASTSARLAQSMGLSQAVPPDNIHRMQKGDPFWCGDLYSANMIVTALALAGKSPCGDQTFLDFGCSSGSLIRVIKSLYPASTCVGVDPVQSSIDWASANLAGINFSVSPLDPPLNLTSGSIDVISAISIWSHFSPSSAVQWLDEMARLLSPQGVLAFTFHSIYTLLWCCRNQICPPELIDQIHGNICSQGFHFQSLDIEAELPQSSNWGNMYMSIEYLYSCCSKKWDVLLYQPGRSQYNQDLIVMSPKPLAT